MPEHRPETPPSSASNQLQDKAKLAAQGAAGSAVKHLKSVAVVESSGLGIVWEGKVEVFEVLNPPPNRVYALPVQSENGPDYVVVLGVYPVDSPLDAVRSWLAREDRKKPEPPK